MDMADLNEVDKALLQQALDYDPTHDVIEEMIAAAGNPTGPPPSTGSLEPPSTNREDDPD
jgi:hypothetical protein